MVVASGRLVNDRHWQDAGRLLRERGIAEAGHQALRENVATYLSHRTSTDELPPRWQAKLDRDLSNPYTTRQVQRRIDQLQKRLKQVLDELPAYPSQLHLTGSFSRGRLGANSDLDAYATVRPEHLKAGFDAFEKTVDQGEACLVPLSEATPGLNLGNLLAAGASVRVQPERLAEPGYLRKVYRHVQTHRQQRKETSSVFEWMTGMVWGEELTPRQKRLRMEQGGLTHQAMAVAGSMAGVPVLSSAVYGTANLFVTQSHLGALGLNRPAPAGVLD
ncbi:MAG: hypothetical protein U0931_26875 [Vulcanimicrobiota bacterium]